MLRILLMAAVALSQDDPAAFLKKVEEKALTAKSLRFKAKIKIESPGQTVELDAAGSIAGSRFKFTMEGSVAGRITESSALCDGSKLRLHGAGEPKITDAPRDAALLRTLLVQGGAFAPLQSLIASAKPPACSDIKFAADARIGDRDAKVLTFTIAAEGDEKKGSGTLWIDAATLALLKREVKGAAGTVTETYVEWTVDEDLKDDGFALPKDK